MACPKCKSEAYGPCYDVSGNDTHEWQVTWKECFECHYETKIRQYGRRWPRPDYASAEVFW